MGADSRDPRDGAWFLAVTGALVISAAVLGLFRAPAPALVQPGPPSPPATVEIAPTDAMIHEQASFYDPTPLFLPTQWNAKPNVLQGVTVREPGDDFSYDAPVNASKLARLAFPAKVNVPASPVDALSLWAGEAPFLGMGETDLKVEPLPVRDALVEVVTASDGRQVFTQALKGARPPGGGDWQPMEFLVAVEPAGLIGLPVPAPSSNAVEVATYFQNYLAKVLKVGERLAPGFYRIKVGP